MIMVYFSLKNSACHYSEKIPKTIFSINENSLFSLWEQFVKYENILIFVWERFPSLFQVLSYIGSLAAEFSSSVKYKFLFFWVSSFAVISEAYGSLKLHFNSLYKVLEISKVPINYDLFLIAITQFRDQRHLNYTINGNELQTFEKKMLTSRAIFLLWCMRAK